MAYILLFANNDPSIVHIIPKFLNACEHRELYRGTLYDCLNSLIKVKNTLGRYMISNINRFAERGIRGIILRAQRLLDIKTIAMVADGRKLRFREGLCFSVYVLNISSLEMMSSLWEHATAIPIKKRKKTSSKSKEVEIVKGSLSNDEIVLTPSSSAPALPPQNHNPGTPCSSTVLGSSSLSTDDQLPDYDTLMDTDTVLKEMEDYFHFNQDSSSAAATSPTLQLVSSSSTDQVADQRLMDSTDVVLIENMEDGYKNFNQEYSSSSAATLPTLSGSSHPSTQADHDHEEAISLETFLAKFEISKSEPSWKDGNYYIRF